MGIDAHPAARPERDLAVGRHPFVGAVSANLVARCGVRPGGGVVVGCSGGADSVALLLAVSAIAKRGGPDAPALRPTVVHVNHHLRADAACDESFVATLAQRLELPHRSVGVHPEREAGNVSEAARRLRYAALREAALDVGAAHVVVAHHAEDQLESMLMALGRGAGIDGLSAMAWTRSLIDGGGNSVRLARPLLDRRRVECEELCREAGIEWCADPGNVDVTRSRARLRAEVLPVLESLWPGAATRAAGTADLLGALRPLLERELEGVFGSPGSVRWDRDRLRTLSPPLIAAGLRRAAAHRLGRASDALGRRSLVPAAQAIASGERAPRTFHWTDGLVLTVTAREVTLAVQDPMDVEPAM